MNYLFHLYLSGDDPDLLTGNFMGDFVKGHLGDRFPASIRAGIQLHRAIDSFAHTDLHFNQSRLRIDTSFGLYRGILVDIFYDHFLAASWEHWSDEPLPRYLGRVREAVEKRRHLLPERLQQLVPIIFEDLIPSYLDTEGIRRALDRMSRRIRRPNPLAGGAQELVLNYAGFREDFEQFLPDATRFALAYHPVS